MIDNVKPIRVGVGTLDLTALEKKYVNQVLDSGRLSYGPFLARFEREFAALHGAKYAVMVNSGTSALEIAVAALRERGGWRDGDEVLVPATTFVATANVLLLLRLTPIFVDVDPRTYNIDPAQIEKRITPRTRAIMPVHLFGQPCEMDPIMEIARRRGLKVIEDSCETMFANYRDRPVGSFGDIACFSTYVAHLLVTGVGGLALTNDPELAVILKSLANHGRDSVYLSLDDRDKAADNGELFRLVAGRFSFVRLGYSYRVTELEGALGLAQLERREAIVGGHQKNARELLRLLEPFQKFLDLPWHPEHSEHSFMMFPLMIRDERVSRKDLIMFLEERGIETRDMLPLINQPFYRERFGDLTAEYPAASRIIERGFYIGCHQKLLPEDLEYVAETFREFFVGLRKY